MLLSKICGRMNGGLKSILGACLCGFVLVPPATAQGMFGLGQREGFVEFGAEEDSIKSSVQGISDLSTSQRRFVERVGLRGDLYLIDPSFLTLTSGATFDFFQDHLTSNEELSAGTGELASYNFEARLLPGKQYTATVFANRMHSTHLREFAGTSELLTRNLGATVNLKSLFLPSTATYRQELTDERSHSADLLGERKEFTKIFTYDGRNHWESNDLGVRYEFANVKDLVIPSLSYRTHTGGVTHRFRFGKDLPRLLNFNLNYVHRNDTARLSSSALTADGEFDIQHTKTLSTAYHYVLSRYTAFGSETTAHTAAVSLQHQLYESLRTNLIFQGIHATLSNGTQTIYGGRVDSAYRKKLPAKGTLIANLDTRYEIQNDQIQGKTFSVFQEQHTAQIGIPFRLNQPRAIPGSVSVSGVTGTIVFVEGLDYLVRQVGEFVEIEVLPTGRIREGEVLLVDYQVSATPALEFSTLSGAFNIGADFGWVYPYYTFERNRQRLLAGLDAGSLENLRAHTLGARFRWTTKKLSALLINEYRSQDSRLLPYSSLQFSQLLAYSPRPSVTASLNFDEALSHYARPERRTTNGLGRLNIALTPLASLTVDGFLSLRLWRDSIAVDETFEQGGVRLHWTVSKFTATFSLSRDVRIRDTIQSREFRWFANIVRRF